MIVRDNPGGRRTVRYLGQTNSKVGKELEKLSSGYKINRAADDAAGLAVSEKMRAQITGLSRAKINSQEGCSLIQTGEGALEEVHDMLNRASELANQSANGIYEDELDRENLQKELDNLCQEIDRISTGANFNGIKLFQDDGLEFERSPGTPTYPSADPVQLEAVRTKQSQAGRSQPPEVSRTAPLQTVSTPAALSQTERTQAELGDGTRQVVQITYIEHDVVSTTQAPNGSSTLGKDIMVQENGVSKKLSDILKDEIIPNTVSNILSQYGAAFSYLTGSSIGMGLEYFSEGSSGGSTVLAYVGGEFHSTGTASGGSLLSRTDTISYTLGVNVAAIDPAAWENGGREELEATIAHEMIHAFMDEAATMGMSGKQAVDTTALVQDVNRFPSWFIEGMAQTASGPGNWLKSSGGLNIDVSSDAAAITSAISTCPLGPDDNASNYGTGYLACMYLGAVIGGYDGTDIDPQSVAETVSSGLSQLLSAIIHDGKSMNTAIQDLTKGKSASFTNTADFVSKFNSGSAGGMTDFIHNLLTATGATGRGGVASGDLSHHNLTADSPSSSKLFELNTNTSKVTNTYPEGYNVYSGGAASVEGVAPTDNEPILPYIDFDNIRIYGVKDSNLVYNSADGTLTIKAGAGIKISVRPSGEAIGSDQPHGRENVQNLTLASGVGGTVLSGVNLSGNLTVQGNAEITYESDNSFGGIKLGGDIVFKGAGGLKTVTFDAGSHNATFQGGSVVVNRGSGPISNPGTVTIEGAAIAAAPDIADSTGRSSIDIPWTPELDALGKLASIQVDGQQYNMSLDAGQAAKLWLEPGRNHRVTFTDVDGKAKTLSATQVFEADGVTFQEFKWAPPARPYTVTGGQEGVDWEYTGPDGNTLLIKSNAEELTIGPGPSLNTSGQPVDENGNVLVGRIQVADNIGNQGAAVKLTLDGISSTVSTGAAFDLGKNNQVELTLADGTVNTFRGGSNYAGISVGDGTQLTINGTGTLNATGGSNGAGIGRNGAATSDQTSSITINGGTIFATGGGSGAGIGAGSRAAFGDITINGGAVNAAGGSDGAGIGAGDSGAAGDITINGGAITAIGGYGGAGIGGAYNSLVGDISIKDAEVTAVSRGHGAGIGGGWGSAAKNGTITIDGSSRITASSPEHGTGIGAGCQGTSGDITIKGSTVIELARGGNDGAGIGASWLGKCGNVTIEGNAEVKLAQGGSNGAGIGAGGDSSRATGKIKIDTTGSVKATGGINGVGIGSGYLNSSCGDIEIVQGTVSAQGSTDSTGIGAGRDSTSGSIMIGDPSGSKKVVVSADGGMSNDGGNIMSYTDAAHQNPGSVKIVGDNTSVKPGEAGEGKFSTSGVPADSSVSDVSGLDDKDKLFSYPVYLFAQDPPPAVAETSKGSFPLPLPDDAENIQISATSASGTKTWAPDLSHDPFDSSFAYIWMTGEDQTLTITYDSPTEGSGTKTLNLKFFPGAGVFRTANQPVPSDAKEPEYSSEPTPPGEPITPRPSSPSTSGTPKPLEPPVTPDPPKSRGGIILQIGANYGEILEVPRFYLSSRALGLDNVDISTQDNALASISILKDAINRVSSIRGEYGALQNRLEHNQNDLSAATENLTDAESRIRDADMAEEYAQFAIQSILQQTGQAMAAHSNNDANRVLQLLQ